MTTRLILAYSIFAVLALTFALLVFRATRQSRGRRRSHRRDLRRETERRDERRAARQH